MTVAVAQETSNEDPNFSTAGTSIAKAFAGACTNPSVIHAIVTCDTDVTATAGVSDPTNGAYTLLDKFFDAGSGTFNAHFYVKNTAATALTVTCAFGATVHIKGIIIREVTGADSSTPVNPSTVHAGQEQASPATSADAVTSGTFSTPNLPGLISAVSVDDSGTGAPAAGTGFTSTLTTWAFGGSILARSEHKRVTAGATQAGTFTAGGAGRPHGTMAVLFVESGGAGPVVNTKSQTENLTIADQATKVRRSTRALIEAFLVDPDTSTKVNATFLGETVTITDLMSGQVVKVRLSTDALTASDRLTDSVYRNRFPSDSIAITDTLAEFAVRCRVLNETIAMIDVLTKASSGVVNTKSISEAFLIADILAQYRRLNRALGETLSLTDALTAFKTGIQIKLLSEAISIGDSNAESVYRSRLLIDAAAFVDSIAGQKGKFATITDSFAVADSVLKFVMNARAVAESMIVNDIFAKFILAQRALPEFISMLDVEVGQYIPFINVSGLVKVQIKLGCNDSIYLSASDPVRLGFYDPVVLGSAA